MTKKPEEIKINCIKYKKVPFKSNDKVCKDCDYFLDNGHCDFEDGEYPCNEDNILERVKILEKWQTSQKF